MQLKMMPTMNSLQGDLDKVRNREEDLHSEECDPSGLILARHMQHRRDANRTSRTSRDLDSTFSNRFTDSGLKDSLCQLAKQKKEMLLALQPKHKKRKRNLREPRRKRLPGPRKNLPNGNWFPDKTQSFPLIVPHGFEIRLYVPSCLR